jgi:hypothetical protein
MHGRLVVNVCSQKVFNRKEVSVWYNKFKDGRRALSDGQEKQRSRPRTSHTDDNCVIVEGLIRGD